MDLSDRIAFLLWWLKWLGSMGCMGEKLVRSLCSSLWDREGKPLKYPCEDPRDTGTSRVRTGSNFALLFYLFVYY
jgi:hypothetical protein